MFLVAYALLAATLAVLFLRLPTGFLPTEDDGTAMVQFTLPAGATQTRTAQTADAVERYFLRQEDRNVSALFSVNGFGSSLPRQSRSPAKRCSMPVLLRKWLGLV